MQQRRARGTLWRVALCAARLGKATAAAGLTLRQPDLAASGHAELRATAGAGHNSLGVAEDRSAAEGAGGQGPGVSTGAS